MRGGFIRLQVTTTILTDRSTLTDYLDYATSMKKNHLASAIGFFTRQVLSTKSEGLHISVRAMNDQIYQLHQLLYASKLAITVATIVILLILLDRHLLVTFTFSFTLAAIGFSEPGCTAGYRTLPSELHSRTGLKLRAAAIMKRSP